MPSPQSNWTLELKPSQSIKEFSKCSPSLRLRKNNDNFYTVVKEKDKINETYTYDLNVNPAVFYNDTIDDNNKVPIDTSTHNIEDKVLLEEENSLTYWVVFICDLDSKKDLNSNIDDISYALNDYVVKSSYQTNAYVSGFDNYKKLRVIKHRNEYINSNQTRQGIEYIAEYTAVYDDVKSFMGESILDKLSEENLLYGNNEKAQPLLSPSFAEVTATKDTHRSKVKDNKAESMFLEEEGKITYVGFFVTLKFGFSFRCIIKDYFPVYFDFPLYYSVFTLMLDITNVLWAFINRYLMYFDLANNMISMMVIKNEDYEKAMEVESNNNHSLFRMDSELGITISKDKTTRSKARNSFDASQLLNHFGKNYSRKLTQKILTDSNNTKEFDLEREGGGKRDRRGKESITSIQSGNSKHLGSIKEEEEDEEDIFATKIYDKRQSHQIESTSNMNFFKASLNYIEESDNSKTTDKPMQHLKKKNTGIVSVNTTDILKKVNQSNQMTYQEIPEEEKEGEEDDLKPTEEILNKSLLKKNSTYSDKYLSSYDKYIKSKSTGNLDTSKEYLSKGFKREFYRKEDGLRFLCCCLNRTMRMKKKILDIFMDRIEEQFDFLTDKSNVFLFNTVLLEKYGKELNTRIKYNYLFDSEFNLLYFKDRYNINIDKKLEIEGEVQIEKDSLDAKVDKDNDLNFIFDENYRGSLAISTDSERGSTEGNISEHLMNNFDDLRKRCSSVNSRMEVSNRLEKADNDSERSIGDEELSKKNIDLFFDEGNVLNAIGNRKVVNIEYSD